LWHRTRRDKSRPLLQGADPRVRLEELYAVRDPLYREVADIIVESGSGGSHHLVKQLEREVRSRCAA